MGDLTLLADSVMAGVAAFLFATVVITLVGEIIPQAHFSRHALWVAARLAPLLRVYRILLWPVARTAAALLDAWVGPEAIPWFREAELQAVLRHHARSMETEVGRLEATGAINFLVLDDLPVGREGEPVDPLSIVSLPVEAGRSSPPSLGRPTIPSCASDEAVPAPSHTSPARVRPSARLVSSRESPDPCSVVNDREGGDEHAYASLSSRACRGTGRHVESLHPSALPA